MNHYTVTGFSSIPAFAQGLVRDLRVRWALREAGLPYEVELIDPAIRKSEAYRRKQPFGMVPAFAAGGVELFESGAIVQLIAEKSEALLPAEEADRARTIVWMYAALNNSRLRSEDGIPGRKVVGEQKSARGKRERSVVSLNVNVSFWRRDGSSSVARPSEAGGF